VTSPHPVVAAVEPLLASYLERQTWYWAASGVPAPAASSRVRPKVTLVESELLQEGPPGSEGAAGLARLALTSGELRLQVTIGWRDATSAASVLRGRESAILGACALEGAGEVLVYDALADEELLLVLLSVATKGAGRARRARVVESLTSHASIVYDDRLFMKLYRVLDTPPRPEVEVMVRLDDVGFNHIAAPVGVWATGDADLALVREFFPDGVEGRALALTSLRDLLGGAPGEVAEDPDEAASRAGGDLASEIRRLGDTTARLHLALANAFGEQDADLGPLAEVLAAGDPAAAERLASVGSAGRMIRVHGDYHLRRVMRTDSGWIVVGFGDDPSRAARLGPTGRGVLGTPLDDVADMCHAIAAEAAAGHQQGARGRALASAWARRNTAALLEGYLSTAGIARLLPAERGDIDSLLSVLGSVRAWRAAGAGR
jgi:maltokinase